MKKYFLLLALVAGIARVAAQQPAGNRTHHHPSGRIISPFGLEVTYDKTVHILFPSAIRYVDLGSQSLLAGKADGAENVLRVKAAVRNFDVQTNLTVITENGDFYTFNVEYAAEPRLLNIVMEEAPRDGSEAARSDIPPQVQLGELGGESPRLVERIMKHIHRRNERTLRGVDDRAYGMRAALRGLHTCNGLLYFHVLLRNEGTVPYDIDFISYKIVDRKVARRTARQERVLLPLRSYNSVTRIDGGRQERMVLVFGTLMIPDDKQLLIELHERGGGRQLTLKVRSGDLMRAKIINALKIR